MFVNASEETRSRKTSLSLLRLHHHCRSLFLHLRRLIVSSTRLSSCPFKYNKELVVRGNSIACKTNRRTSILRHVCRETQRETEREIWIDRAEGLEVRKYARQQRRNGLEVISLFLSLSSSSQRHSKEETSLFIGIDREKKPIWLDNEQDERNEKQWQSIISTSRATLNREKQWMNENWRASITEQRRSTTTPKST